MNIKLFAKGIVAGAKKNAPTLLVVGGAGRLTPENILAPLGVIQVQFQNAILAQFMFHQEGIGKLLELANIHLRELRVIEVVKVGLLLEDALDETQVVEHGLGTDDEISRVAALLLRIRRFLLQIACLGFIFFIDVRGVDTRSGRAYQGLSFRDRGSRRVLLLRKGIHNSLRRSFRGLLAGCQKCHCRKKCK